MRLLFIERGGYDYTVMPELEHWIKDLINAGEIKGDAKPKYHKHNVLTVNP